MRFQEAEKQMDVIGDNLNKENCSSELAGEMVHCTRGNSLHENANFHCQSQHKQNTGMHYE